MQPDEKIQAHLVSVWRESQKFFSIGGKEGMFILTDKHLMFIHKTKVKMNWWRAVTQRQVVKLIKSKNTMIIHDGYDEEDLRNDLEDKRNIELAFDDISSINFEEKNWGSVLQLKYKKEDKEEKFQYTIAKNKTKKHTRRPLRIRGSTV